VLRLTRRSEYGIIAMTHLAQHPDEAVSSRDISERYNIPKRLLAEVMKDLVHRGQVRSVRGAAGGYVLSADPAKITVLSLLQALEGPFEMVPCTSTATAPASNGGCELVQSCPIKAPIHRIHEKINQMLATVTVGELARGDGPLAAMVPSVRALSTANPARTTN
jgi:Rrf2 family protein